jgi:hypothetical protein
MTKRLRHWGSDHDFLRLICPIGTTAVSLRGASKHWAPPLTDHAQRPRIRALSSSISLAAWALVKAPAGRSILANSHKVAR